MGKINIGLVVTIVAVLVVLSIVFLAAYLAIPNTGKLEEILGIAQSLVTILAIVTGESSLPTSGRYSGNPNRT